MGGTQYAKNCVPPMLFVFRRTFVPKLSYSPVETHRPISTKHLKVQIV